MCIRDSCKTADALTKINGVKLLSENFFNEFTIELPKSSKDVVEALSKKGIIAGYALDDNQLLVAATEMTTNEDIEKLTAELKEVLA